MQVDFCGEERAENACQGEVLKRSKFLSGGWDKSFIMGPGVQRPLIVGVVCPNLAKAEGVQGSTGSCFSLLYPCKNLLSQQQVWFVWFRPVQLQTRSQN